ncbi:CDP-alcohol phosphatidyltransferase family protein [Candidatus Woesearchaeota archaeon]|nr:CDP-alcohol phosphatidyltransferase family protein [Candidatus Woesearchaeota archaeon]
MNLPNFLVVVRIAYLPIIVICTFFNTALSNAIAIFLLALSIILDFIDGKIARRYGKVSKFGSYWDQLSDKLLVNLLWVTLLALGIFPLWAVLLNLAREFVVHEVRLVAKSKDLILASEKSGKLKAALQMITVFVALVLNLMKNLNFNLFNILQHSKSIVLVLLLATLFVAYYALVEFFVKNKNFIKNIP